MSRPWTPTLRSKRGTTLPSPKLAPRPVAVTRPSPGSRSASSSGTSKRGTADGARPTTPTWGSAIVGFTVAVAVVVSGFLIGKMTSTSSRPAASAAAPAASLSPGPPVDVTSLFVRATPADALLFVDDAPLADNPARAPFPRDGRQHTVRAEAPGHAPKEISVAFDSPSLAVDIALDAEPKVPSPSAHKGLAPARPHGAPATVVAPSAEPSARKKPPLDTTDPWQR